MSCQLNSMRAAPSGTFHCPSHHLASDSMALKPLIDSDKLDLGPQSSLKTDRGQEHEMQSSDHLPIPFGNNQFMVWIVINLVEC